VLVIQAAANGAREAVEVIPATPPAPRHVLDDAGEVRQHVDLGRRGAQQPLKLIGGIVVGHLELGGLIGDDLEGLAPGELGGGGGGAIA
jgi:hypothetical protein